MMESREFWFWGIAVSMGMRIRMRLRMRMGMSPQQLVESRSCPVFGSARIFIWSDFIGRCIIIVATFCLPALHLYACFVLDAKNPRIPGCQQSRMCVPSQLQKCEYCGFCIVGRKQTFLCFAVFTRLYLFLPLKRGI